MDERKLPALAEALSKQIQIGVYLLKELDKLTPSMAVERHRDALIESLQLSLDKTSKAVIQGFDDVFDVPSEVGELEAMGVNFLKLDNDFQDI